jgi:hypothetical protein
MKKAASLRPFVVSGQAREGLITAAIATTATTSAATWACTVGAAETAVAATTAAAVAAATAFTTATAAATTAVTAAATTEAAAASAGRTSFHRTCFVHNHGTATQRLTVHAVDGSLGISVRAHFHKTKTFGATGVALHHHFGAGDSTELTKRLLQIAIAHRVGQIAHIQFITHENQTLEGTPKNTNNKR